MNMGAGGSRLTPDASLSARINAESEMRSIESGKCIFSIILIDDECLVCNRLAKMVARHDSERCFRIAGIQSDKGKKILSAFGLESASRDSVILIHNGNSFSGAEAVELILTHLKKTRWAGKIIHIFPRSLSDWAYMQFSKNRYRLFGKADYCRNDPEIRRVFL